jgi:hypothetical protein
VYVILSDPELRQIYKQEHGQLYHFALANGETLDTVVDNSAVSVEDIKNFKPMFKTLCEFKKQPIRQKTGIVIPVYGMKLKENFEGEKERPLLMLIQCVGKVAGH